MFVVNRKCNPIFLAQIFPLLRHSVTAKKRSDAAKTMFIFRKNSIKNQSDNFKNPK